MATTSGNRACMDGPNNESDLLHLLFIPGRLLEPAKFFPRLTLEPVEGWASLLGSGGANAHDISRGLHDADWRVTARWRVDFRGVHPVHDWLGPVGGSGWDPDDFTGLDLQPAVGPVGGPGDDCSVRWIQNMELAEPPR